MSIVSSLESIVAQVVKQHWGIDDPVLIRSSIVPTQTMTQGDIGISLALTIAGRLGASPMAIAAQLSEDLTAQVSPFIDHVTVASPGYVNVRIREGAWIAFLNDQEHRRLRAQTTDVLGQGRNVIIDYSSPNIAKPMSVAHLRSTIIGDALAAFYKRANWNVIRWNHLGDWGTQFGKMIVAIRRHHKEDEVARMNVEELLALYVWFHDQVASDPSLEEAAREETKKLQNGDEDNKKIWREIVETSKREFRGIYNQLNIQIDQEFGESEYQSDLESIVGLLLQERIAHESEGAVVVSFDNPPRPTVVIKKGDGAYLYMTTDVASAQFRRKRYQADRLVYVVANQQALHFQQLFCILEQLGWFCADQLYHVKFGMVLGTDGKKLATREGKVIGLKELMRESLARTKELIAGRMPSDEQDAIAAIIGIGALKYNDLSHNRVHDITFDWSRALNLHGNSAPYLQYVCVRIQHIIDRVCLEYGQEVISGEIAKQEAFTLHDTERSLLQWLAFSQNVVDDVLATHEPHRCADYLYELGQRFHAFYEQCSVVDAQDDQYRLMRVRLCMVVKMIMEDGLGLLGINVPDKM